MTGRSSRTLLGLSVGILAALPLTAQAAVDPSIAPRAMELARHGERTQRDREVLDQFTRTLVQLPAIW